MVRLRTLTLLCSNVVAVAVAATCASNTLETDYPAPVAANGWTYRLIAKDLSRPRGILFDNEGGLIIVDSGAGLVHLKIKDDGGSCLSVEEKTTLLETDDLNHGIALSEDGKTLYASSTDKVYSWSYDARSVKLSDSNRTLVANMSNSGHTSRTLLLSRRHPDYLLVSRGSAGNVDDEAESLDSGHSQLRAFNVTGGSSSAYDYLDGDLLGWGLRNSVGVAENPSDGGIWSVENSADELRRNGEDIHTNNPAEELNFHGYLNGSFKDSGSSNYGYPLCYALWSTDDFPDLGSLTTGDQFPVEETSSLTDDKCNADYVAPVLSFQAHMAPLDIKFDKNGTQAYISFHGSWNRQDPVGYHISSVAFKDGKPVDASNSTDAETPILSNKDLGNCPDNCFRPVGLTWDSSDRLWFSSDSTGEIFVLVRDGSNNTNDSGGDTSSGDDGDDSAATNVSPARTTALLVTLAAMVMGLCLS